MKATNEDILQAALQFFSENGYEGTLLRDIAASLHLTKSALYKHYVSKEELWNAMVQRLEDCYARHMEALKAPKIPSSLSELKDASMAKLDFTVRDESMIRTRRLLYREQYRDGRTTDLAAFYLHTGLQHTYEKIFAGMMEKGLIKPADPALLSLQYAAPLSDLIHLCDLQPENLPHVMEQTERHIDFFLEKIQ